MSERGVRPPPGRPDEFKGALAAWPAEEQRIIGLLYGPAESSEITYRDIYELLRKELTSPTQLALPNRRIMRAPFRSCR